MTSNMTAAQLRAQLDHPIIDSDGHLLEITPAILEFIDDVGGSKYVDRYLSFSEPTRRPRLGKQPIVTLGDRRDRWIGKSSWWSHTVNTVDRATSMLPKLFVERMGELGIDYSVVYPSEGLGANRIEDDADLRVVVCRAVNKYQAELYGGLEQHLTGVAVIPMGSPAEAIEELEHVAAAGFKTAMFSSAVRRGIPYYERDLPDAAHLAARLDFFGIDSPHDYDPLWQKCVDLQFPVTFHGLFVGSSSGPVSPTNLIFNRLAGINAYPALAAALLLGGVVTRFPTLKFAFQECGVGWACDFFGQLLGMWEKRSEPCIREYNPENLDIATLKDLVTRYGDDRSSRHLGWIDSLVLGLVEPDVIDEFTELGATSPQQLADLFTDSFYFGCEADDAMNARAFSGNPQDAVLKITLGSDIGHWDVPDVSKVLPEAFELVEHGYLSLEEFRAFTFENAVNMLTSMNPHFFDGTVIEEHLDVSATSPIKS